MIEFLKFVFGAQSDWKYFRYCSTGQHWCPRRLEWTNDFALPGIELYPAIWMRRARRWFQGKRDHQTP
jgi:hypothetical protein